MSGLPPGSRNDCPGARPLFLEQGLQFVARRCRGTDTGSRPALPKTKIFAEVRPVSFQDPIRLRFSALVVHGGFMKEAIQAAAQLGPAVRTGILSPDRIGRDNLLTAGVAALHRVRSVPKAPGYPAGGRNPICRSSFKVFFVVERSRNSSGDTQRASMASSAPFTSPLTYSAARSTMT